MLQRPALIDFDRLYSLHSAHASPFAADPEPFPSADEMAALALGERAESPHAIVWRYSSGRRQPSDLVGGAGAVLLISPRFRHALRDADATGWTSRPVELYDAEGQPIDGYERLVVTGRCGPIDPDRSRRETINETTVLYGFYFEPGSWDRSDVFSPAPRTDVLLTQRAADAVRKLSNVAVEPLSGIEHYPIMWADA